MSVELTNISSLQTLVLPQNDIAWLAQQRADALNRYEKIGLPSVRDEDWRYTNLNKLKRLAFTKSKSSDTTNTQTGVELPPVSHTRLVFVDGNYNDELSTITGLVNGLTITQLSSLLNDNAELLAPYFGHTLPESDQKHGFIELNTAFCHDGYVIKADANTASKTPIEIVFIHNKLAEPQISHSRNLIIAEKNSQITVIERHLGVDEAVYLNNSITEIVAQDNAQVDHYKLQTESNDAFHIGGVFCHQQRSSTVTTHNISLGGLVVRNDVNMQLLGEGAHAEFNGLVLGKGRQHTDNFTQVNHAVPHCTSDEFYKNILDDSSRSVFRGRIIVAKDAQQTDAQQQNKNLLLSADAEIDSKPQLEIYADDVKCSHGATVGQLDPKSIFYLQSRGIDLASARALLTFAFANEVIQRIKVDSVRNELTHIVAGQLIEEIEGVL